MPPQPNKPSLSKSLFAGSIEEELILLYQRIVKFLLVESRHLVPNDE